MSLYCRNQHPNPVSSKFCSICGDLLQTPTANALLPGSAIGSRYRIIRELGHGGFGRTYLAEDLNRFNEHCVLKEFAPQVHGTQAVLKASELFEREAGVLYKLKHPQVPHFRELLRVQLPDGGKLFLVQDFVDGETYQSLLNARRQQGQVFTEAEVVQLLRQLLPVLEYLHGLGVVHRDISPDNLIVRQADGLPVLIDFGGVKQLAATVESALAAPMSPTLPLLPAIQGTRLGKVGYAPEEQIRMGIAYPHSDLYALAMTIVVLLTGRDPQDLVNPHTLEWQWQQYTRISPALAGVLTQMLARQPGDRFQSAQHVLHALNSAALGSAALGSAALDGTSNPQSPDRQLAPIPATYPLVHQPAYPPPLYSPSSPNPPALPAAPLVAPITYEQEPANSSGVWSFLVGGVLIFGAAIAGWWFANHYFQRRPVSDSTQSLQSPTTPPATTTPATTAVSQLPTEEQTRKQAMNDRRQKLGIANGFFAQLVNQEFYATHPDLKGRQLTDNADDAPLRAQWDKIANEFLARLERLSPEARHQLGSYGKADRERWGKVVNESHLSSRALYDLADARFFHLFPEYQGTNLSRQPMEQVWHGIASDLVPTIAAGTTLETITFQPGRFDTRIVGTLQPGGGKAYIANFKQGQGLRLTWQADQKALVSLYPPRSTQKPLLEDSQETTWSGTLADSGYYELVIVTDGAEPVAYTIDLAADNVSTPASPSLTP